MFTIAILGAGRIGSIHAANTARHPGARLLGIADTDAARAQALAASLGSEAITLDQAFTADAVIIATPTPTHAGYIERAAKYGRAVFCEKPISLSAARTRETLVAANHAAIPLMVGFNRRFDPHFATLKHRLNAGGIGSLELLTITSRDPAPPPPAYIETSGGLFRDMMIHDFDMARFLLNEEPVAVTAIASCLVDPSIAAAGDVDTAIVTLGTASGRLCQISNSRRAVYGYDQRIEAHGSAGLLRAGNVVATTIEHADAAGFHADPALPFFLERYEQAYRAELDAFIRLAGGETVAVPTGYDGLRALLLAEAAEQALTSGTVVRPEGI